MATDPVRVDGGARRLADGVGGASTMKTLLTCAELAVLSLLMVAGGVAAVAALWWFANP